MYNTVIKPIKKQLKNGIALSGFVKKKVNLLKLTSFCRKSDTYNHFFGALIPRKQCKYKTFIFFLRKKL